MEKVFFFKMSGCGNDFIIIDNRHQMIEKNIEQFVQNVCRRKVSVGSDGLILIENSDVADFKWRFFNSDGSEAEMCGNGARCVARYASLNGIAGPTMSFETKAGIISATVSDKMVKVKASDPSDLKTDYIIKVENGPMTICSVNTGVPHVVVFADDIDTAEVVKTGKEIRFHDMFAPAGTNVNFASLLNSGVIAIRTYERGVEDETLACGTGAIAAAIVFGKKLNLHSPVDILTKSGGHLYVYYEEKNGGFINIFLEGDARIIYKGELWEDAWKQI